MLRKLCSFFCFLVIAGCIEPYDFIVHEPSPSLVIEANLSDKSFNETLAYPSDGRYFTVKLSETGDVTNLRPIPVKGALVELVTSDGEVLAYSEREGGIYELRYDDFKALKGVEYQLRISTSDDDVYESTWEALPDVEPPPIGDIGFSETTKEVYVMEAGEWALRRRQVVMANIAVGLNTTGQTIYYRYGYSPIWVYVAPLTSQIDSVYRCWATEKNYLNSFELQVDRAGGYRKDLFSIPTIRNERIFEKFSVLVVQHAMTESYYNFWRELKDQNEGSALIDTPPYNLQTNFSSPTGAKKASGYFGVTSEQAVRWYFDKSDLSYYVENTLKADCLVDYGPGPPDPSCTDCTAYPFGIATTRRPAWWLQ